MNDEVKSQSPTAPESQLDIWMESRPRIGSTTLGSGKIVYFLSMDGATQHRLVVHQETHPKDPLPDAELLAWCLCDENGRRLWNEETWAIGVAVLQGRDAPDLRKVAMAILNHSKIPTSDKERAEQTKKS